MKTKVKQRDITFGTDVEAGLFHNGVAKNIPCTAFNTPYTKDKRKVWGLEGSYHRDNILTEFQTPVCSTWKDLCKAIMVCHKLLSEEYSRLNCNLVYQPVITYKDQEMVEIDEAYEMGCDPDICAYSGQEVVGPDADTMGQRRAASGHIHIGGIEDMSDEQKRQLVLFLDATIGQYTAAREAELGDSYKYRRHWYGQAGRYRLKPYGIEYRTPSNMWVGDLIAPRGPEPGDDASTYISKAIIASIDLIDQGKSVVDFIAPSDMDRVRAAIDGTFHFKGGRVIDWWAALHFARQCTSDALYDLGVALPDV